MWPLFHFNFQFVYLAENTLYSFYEVNSASDVRDIYCFFGSENFLKLTDILGKILCFLM